MLWSELINEEREEAKEEGRIEGRIQGQIEMLLEMLNDLPGIMSADLEERIRGTADMEVLKAYARMARKAASIDEFEGMTKSAE